MSDQKTSPAQAATQLGSNKTNETKRPAKEPDGKGGGGGGNMGPQTLALNTHKAGMEGLDAAKINEIIKKASEGSRFYQHKQKCQQRLDAKIAEMMKAKASFCEQQINRATHQMDQLVEELENERDLTHTIVHVDMDMFYAAVEMRDDPSLKDKPMAVGGTGMLSTSNYAARKFGVRAAMPGFIGKKLCPELVIVPPNFTKYKECSKAVQEVFAEYDPNFSPMSLDEAYLDITEYIKKNSHLYSEENDDDVDVGNIAESIVREMREKIHKKTDLTASAGIAPNTRLAKVCSDMNKPNGQFYLPPIREKIMAFVSSLPIRKVSGIGNVSEQQLSALGVKVCSDLFRERGLLKLLFSDLNYNYFMRIALGLGSTTLEAWTERDRKSISTETTFRGTSDKDFLFKQTEELCQELAEDLSEKDIFGKVFTLKIKTTDFKLKTKAHSFFEPTRSCEALVSTARKLLQHEMDVSVQPLSLRLIGVRMSSLLNSSEMGSSRQVTLTDMFSKAAHSKGSSRSSERVVGDSGEKMDSFSGNGEAEVDITCEDHESYISNTNMCTGDRKDELDVREKSVISHIGNFFKSEKKTDISKRKSFECPVCYQQIQATSITKFNIHVDECLQASGTGDSDQISEDSVVSVPLISEKDHTSYKRGEDMAVEKEINIHKNNPVDMSCVSDPVEGTSALSQENQDFSCPICSQKGFYDINLLNQHIDECLNKGTIDMIMKKRNPDLVDSHTKVEKSKGSSFFGSKKCSQSIKESVSGINQPKKKQKTLNNTLEKYFSSS